MTTTRAAAPAADQVSVSNPGKVLFPDDGITKQDLADYYRRVAPVMLPHLQGRPVTMQRFPDGIGEEGFVQQHAPDHAPDWVPRLEVAKEDGTVIHVVGENAATLVWLAGQACITPHVWLSREPDVDHPDQMVFDLDPPDAGGLAAACAIACDLRDVLDQLGLAGFVKSTGSRGVHVVVPLAGATDFDAVRDFALEVGEVMAARDPERVTVAQRKAKRGNRVFVDTLRNGYAQTAVAPYAVRAKPGAPVAVPLNWSELGRGGKTPRRHTLRTLPRRLAQRDDPWEGMEDQARPLDEARRRLETLPR